MLAARLADTGIGIAVGLLVNVMVWPPLRDRGAANQIDVIDDRVGDLLADIAAHRIDAVVVYKVDRLTRSLSDFAKIVEVFDAHGVSFGSITQAFNTTTSMGRLTLNVLLSFAETWRHLPKLRCRGAVLKEIGSCPETGAAPQHAGRLPG